MSSQTHSDYTAAIDILPTLRPTAPDDDCLGLVGELDDRDLRDTLVALCAAGYTVSDSTDEAGVRFVWVVRA